jgi:hypothetical protein
MSIFLSVRGCIGGASHWRSCEDYTLALDCALPNATAPGQLLPQLDRYSPPTLPRSLPDANHSLLHSPFFSGYVANKSVEGIPRSGTSFTRHLIINQPLYITKQGLKSHSSSARTPSPPLIRLRQNCGGLICTSYLELHVYQSTGRLAGAESHPSPLNRSRIPARLRHEERTFHVSSLVPWKNAGLWGWRTYRSTPFSPLAVHSASQAVRTASVVSSVGRLSHVRGAQRSI